MIDRGNLGRRLRGVAFAVAIAALCVPLVVLAKPGGLDKRFGKDGVTVTKVSSRGAGAARVAIQDNGKIVVAGVTFSGSGEDTEAAFLVGGYTRRGKLDRGFGDGGLVAFNVGEGSFWEYTEDLALAADGKILTAGAVNFNEGAAVARLNADGSFDNTLDGDGRLVANAEGLEQATSVLPLPDGDFLVVGQAGKRVAVARFNADGSLDGSWAGDGTATHDLGPGARIARATLDGSGGVVVVVGSDAIGADSFALVRFTPTGVVDPAFGDAGLATAQGVGVTEIALATGGELIAGGRNTVARFTGDGSLDTSFAGDGSFRFSNDRRFAGTGLAVASNGSIAVAGTTGGKLHRRFAVAQLTASGKLNRRFADDGYAVPRLGGQEAALGIAIQDDGKLVAAGRSGGRNIFIGGIGGRETGITLARFLAR